MAYASPLRDGQYVQVSTNYKLDYFVTDKISVNSGCSRSLVVEKSSHLSTNYTLQNNPFINLSYPKFGLMAEFGTMVFYLFGYRAKSLVPCVLFGSLDSFYGPSPQLCETNVAQMCG